MAEHLKRYGLTTRKSGGRKVYGDELLDRLRKVQASYGIDLGFSQEAPTEDVP